MHRPELKEWTFTEQFQQHTICIYTMQNTPTSSLLSGTFLETSGHPWPAASRLSAGEQLHTCSHLNCALPANYSYPRIRNSLTLCQEHKLAGMELCDGKKKISPACMSFVSYRQITITQGRLRLCARNTS